MLLLPWLMAFSHSGDSRQRDAAQQASLEEKLERASSVCRHAGGIDVAALNLPAKPRPSENAETWNTLVATFLSDDYAAVNAMGVDVVLANATEGGNGNSSSWGPDDVYASEMLFDFISSRIALSAPETTINDLLICNP